MINTEDADARFAAYRAQRLFGSLDGLRCICIAMVLWHHGEIWGAMADPWLLLTRGFTGVDFFFVLSGFLITTLLLREEARDGQFRVVDFYWRRALRILPVYVLAVSLIAFWWIVVRGETQWVPTLPYYYLFLANFLTEDIPLLAPMWSLAVEEQYYLIWPALLLLLPALRARLVIVVIMVVICFSAGLGLIPPIEPVAPTEHAQFVLPVMSYLAILVGSLTAILLHHRRGFALLWAILGRHRWAPVVALLATALMLAVLPKHLVNLVTPFFMALSVAALVVREDHALASMLQARPLARIGKISYGLYIWHLIGLHFGNLVTAQAGLTGWTGLWVGTVVYVLAALAIAEASFRLFEIRFLRMKYRNRGLARS